RFAGVSVEKRGDSSPGVPFPEWGIAAGQRSVAGIEDVLAQGDVLAWNIGLTSGRAHDPAVRRGSGAPIDPSVLERQLAGRATRQSAKERGERALRGV